MQSKFCISVDSAPLKIGNLFEAYPWGDWVELFIFTGVSFCSLVFVRIQKIKIWWAIFVGEVTFL